VEGDYGLLAFCLVIAAQFVAVVVVCELRAEPQSPDGPAPRPRRRFTQFRYRGKAGPAPADMVLAVAG
jgi:hypothetical protein